MLIFLSCLLKRYMTIQRKFKRLINFTEFFKISFHGVFFGHFLEFRACIYKLGFFPSDFFFVQKKMEIMSKCNWRFHFQMKKRHFFIFFSDFGKFRVGPIESQHYNGNRNQASILQRFCESTKIL